MRRNEKRENEINRIFILCILERKIFLCILWRKRILKYLVELNTFTCITVLLLEMVERLFSCEPRHRIIWLRALKYNCTLLMYLKYKGIYLYSPEDKTKSILSSFFIYSHFNTFTFLFLFQKAKLLFNTKNL